jgi:fimbrial chaperone protein
MTGVAMWLACKRFAGILGLFFLSLTWSADGWTTTFNVTPLQVFLSAKSPSALVEIRNTGTASTRFQLSVLAWDQSPARHMVLTPTEDIILFPSLLVLAPGETRKVRVGTASPLTQMEQSYRIMVEELPSEETQHSPGGYVHVLSRITLPLFLQPPKRVPGAEIQTVTIQNGRAYFAISNTGNVHFSVLRLQLKGVDAAGEIILNRPLEGWYVLAGGVAQYDVELPMKDCRRITTVIVEMDTDIGPFQTHTDLPANTCGS